MDNPLLAIPFRKDLNQPSLFHRLHADVPRQERNAQPRTSRLADCNHVSATKARLMHMRSRLAVAGLQQPFGFRIFIACCQSRIPGKIGEAPQPACQDGTGDKYPRSAAETTHGELSVAGER